jgi:hypothetical protein
MLRKVFLTHLSGLPLCQMFPLRTLAWRFLRSVISAHARRNPFVLVTEETKKNKKGKQKTENRKQTEQNKNLPFQIQTQTEATAEELE